MISGFLSSRGLRLTCVALEFKSEVHVCPRLAPRIPHLRFVQLQMHRIRPQVFYMEHHKDRDSASKVAKIIINLGLKEQNRFSTGFNHHCTE